MCFMFPYQLCKPFPFKWLKLYCIMYNISIRGLGLPIFKLNVPEIFHSFKTYSDLNNMLNLINYQALPIQTQLARNLLYHNLHLNRKYTVGNV